MFEYGSPAGGATQRPDRTAGARAPSAGLEPGLGPALVIARRRLPLILACGLVGAAAAYGGAHLLTPKYVASTQIFIDPGSAKGGDSQPIALGQDSNGFVNYVESQALIVNSVPVLSRVVRSQHLERDPAFAGGASTLPGEGDGVAATARALSGAVQVRRPERTFVLDISVSYRDPVRAAELANAVAKAYIDDAAQLQSDAARQTGAAIAGHLESLRSSVLQAEKAIEDYKEAHGLIGAGETSLSEQQLRQVHDQIVAVQARAAEAKARVDGADAVRRNGGDLGAFAAQFGVGALTPLRAQLAEARQKFADAVAQLGPRHPQVIDAQASLNAANAAVDAELQRFAASQRLEYQRAKALEADLSRQLESLKTRSNIDSDALIGLRDLQRKAGAARDLYELFVGRARETGEIQQIEPARIKIISAASPPKSRVFPPGAASLAGLGLAGGLVAGFALALAFGGFFAVGGVPPTPRTTRPPLSDPGDAPDPKLTPDPAPARLSMRALGELGARRRELSPDRLNLADIGFPAMTHPDEAAEFSAALDAAGYPAAPSDAGPLRFKLVVVGANDDGLRTALAINLALAASLRGDRVALIDASGPTARLTRAVRLATRRTALTGGAEFETENEVRLVLPQAGASARGRLKPLDWLKLLARRGEFDLLICDGPDLDETEAADSCGLADAVMAREDEGAAAALAEFGVSPRVWLRLEPPALRASA